MPLDSRLYDLMHGNTSNKKGQASSSDRFELAIKERVKKHVEQLISEGAVASNKLVPEGLKQELAEQEVLNSVDLTEFNNHLALAISILMKESNHYLNRIDCAHLIQELERINKNISELELSSLNDEVLYTAISMTHQGLSSILDIAIAKCNEGLLPESLALFALLTTLDSTEPNYWYRLGLVAQRTESYDLAARAYAAVGSMSPEFIGAPIFATECWLKMNQREMALTELAKAKTILKTNPSKEWLQYVIDLESLLSHKSNKGKV